MVVPPPYGYEIVYRKLSIHPDDGKTVKTIYSLFNEGIPVAEIKRRRDKQGITSRRSFLFNTGSINKLLQNTNNIGYYGYIDKKSVQTVEVSCPPLVDETVWNRVQERRQKIFERK